MVDIPATEIDLRLHLSGGTTNTNPNLSIGGPISNTFVVSKTFNNLWSNVSERQRRYGFKDIRIIYVRNPNANTITYKNARVYWNKTDNFTSLQIGRSPVGGVENSTATTQALLPTAEAIPPTMWFAIQAADTFRIVSDFNDTSTTVGTYLPSVPSRDKFGVSVEDSSAPIFNQKIARITFLLKRVGNEQGPINCKIWDFSGNEMANMGSVNSADLRLQGDGTSFDPTVNAWSFTNQTNTYEMQIGDVIGLEYPGAGIDETAGDRDDAILIAKWEWSGDNEPGTDPGNVRNDVQGTAARAWNVSQNEWIFIEAGQLELVYKAEVFGPENPGGDPCNPTPGPGPPGPGPPGPGPPPPPPSGFLPIIDFSDITTTTAYQVGNGGPNNIFRRAVGIDASTSALLTAPIARITFLMRKVGNPIGTATCRIWDNAGTVRQTLGAVSVSGLQNQAPQWTQVPFTLQNNDVLMRVGDMIGVEYVNGTAADHIVLGGWNFASTAQQAADFEAAIPQAATDKFGVRMIYANTGNFLYNWEIPSNSDSMRWDHPNPPTNMEMTGYFQKSSPSSDTVSCKIRGGKHTDSESEAGCCYIPQFPCTGGSMEFEIECPHPNNHSCSISGTHGSALSLAEWHGYKVAVWNTPQNCVHIEAYQDKGNNSGSTPLNQWEKVFVHDDCDGNCGNIDNPLLRPKGSTSQCTFRIDSNSGTQGKWLSLVEITPGIVGPGPGPPPSPPPSPGPVPPPPAPGPSPPPPAPEPSPPPPPRDVPGTSIKRWNGTNWAADDGGNSDLVYKAEKFVTPPDEPGEPPEEDPVLIDPGTKRKPTSFDQGIVLPPLGPGQHKAIILERIFPPVADAILLEEVEQQLVIEIDTTTEPEQPGDPGNPPPVPPPPPSPPPPPPGPGPPSPPPPPPPPTPGPAPGQVGPYPGTGKQLGSTTRRATRHYASEKPDDETIEKNTDNITYQHYQCIYFVTMHEIEHDDTVSSKLGGTHMGTGWHDHGVSFNAGKTCLGTEPNHPDTNSCIKVGASIGSLLEKRVGICTVWRRPNLHTELWTKLPTGNWIKQLENTGALGGFSPNQSGDQEAQLRIDGFQDGSDPSIDTAIVQEIAPG